MKVFAVVLDYCGGDRTDALVASLRAWNPSTPINVLDNGSPHSVCRSVTHRNAKNSFVGGGIRDCLRLAGAEQAEALMFFTNDVECITPIAISTFVAIMEADTRVVHVSAAITADSTQADPFPWMVDCGLGQTRRVRHADILVSLLRVDFIASFGGFPPSQSGWGYAGELAFQAMLQSRDLVVTDGAIVRHLFRDDERPRHRASQQKRDEMIDVYRPRYGGIPWTALHAACAAAHRETGRGAANAHTGECGASADDGGAAVRSRPEGMAAAARGSGARPSTVDP